MLVGRLGQFDRIAGDDARFLQLGDAVLDGRAGEFQFAGQRRDGLASVGG
jgi:hypothetical protein